METLDPNAYLTLDELCDEVNRLRRRFSPLAKTDPVTRAHGAVLCGAGAAVASVRPGPGKKYPRETVWKVLFIRLLSTKRGMPLDHLRQAMKDVPVETMRRVVTGEEPLEVLTTPDAEAVKRHAAQGYQVVPLTGVPARGTDAGDWQVLVRNEDVLLKVREGLAPAKLKQLKHIAALIRALDEAEMRAHGKRHALSTDTTRRAPVDRRRRTTLPGRHGFAVEHRAAHRCGWRGVSSRCSRGI